MLRQLAKVDQLRELKPVKQLYILTLRFLHFGVSGVVSDAEVPEPFGHRTYNT